jgi:hypothetical protein
MVLSLGIGLQQIVRAVKIKGSSHKCVHDNCHLNNCAESPVLKNNRYNSSPGLK